MGQKRLDDNREALQKFEEELACTPAALKAAEVERRASVYASDNRAALKALHESILNIDSPSLDDRRRLDESSLCRDHDVPLPFILAPLFIILMLVLFMYRKPVQRFLYGVGKPSYGGPTI